MAPAGAGAWQDGPVTPAWIRRVFTAGLAASAGASVALVLGGTFGLFPIDGVFETALLIVGSGPWPLAACLGAMTWLRGRARLVEPWTHGSAILGSAVPVGFGLAVLLLAASRPPTGVAVASLFGGFLGLA